MIRIMDAKADPIEPLTDPGGTPSCCAPAAVPAASCCGTPEQVGWRRFDYLTWGSAAAIAVGYAGHFLFGEAFGHGVLGRFAHGTVELMNAMWWGLVLGIVFVGLLDRVPRDVVISALAGERRLTGILRATAAGVLFDLCSHGILMVGMKLYERGATIGQTVAFLLASPWNSLSLTVVLIALIGWWYTLAFVVFSAVIAIITGLVFDALVAAGRLPDNPSRPKAGEVNRQGLRAALRVWLAGVRPSWGGLARMLYDGFRGSRIVLRWLLFGVVLAAAIRAFVPPESFQDWFGPTLLGLFFTIDRDMELGSWIDCGMFIQSIMIAARGEGLETCPQAAFCNYHDTITNLLGTPPEQMLICGMSLGFPLEGAHVNTFRTSRIPVETFVTFRDQPA